jgi:hypothetical protein
LKIVKNLELKIAIIEMGLHKILELEEIENKQ